MRYCTPSGRIAFDVKGAPGTQPPGLYPWYAVPGRAERDLKIVCGHWSTLGLFIGHGVHAIEPARLGRQAHRAAAGYR